MTTARPAATDPVAGPDNAHPAPAMRGADAVLRILEEEGVEVCFGMPGGCILPIYDAIARGTTVRHVLARHEQGAGHMAQGYARVTGGVGVVLATSGPGATNLVTPIADAQMDSTPLVCITGQVRSNLLGTDAFQECDIVGITAPVVKHSWLVLDVEELPGVLRGAFAIARSGRPGPVLVDVPRDVQEAVLAGALEGGPAPDLGGYSPPRAARRRTVAAAAEAILAADRPVLYVGGGAQGDAAVVRALAEKAGIPVVTTLMGKGAFPERHELFAGWPGMHGTRWANLTLNGADLVLAAGARFDDRVTGRLDAFAPGARVVHFDVDGYEIDKVRRADIAVRAPLASSLAGVLGEVRTAAAGGWRTRTAPWREQIAAWREDHPLGYDTDAVTLKPQRVLQRLAALAADRDDVVWTTGVGQHQMWAMQYATCDRPRSFVTSGGHGTMGFGLPAAIGAQIGRPQATVVCVDGDGSFQMTSQELATAVAIEAPVIVVILNNGHLGMVYQWQEMFYDRRHSHIDLLPGMPDFAAIARGYGAVGITVRDEAELARAWDVAVDAHGPVVLDVQVDPDEHCFPMIKPGAAAVDMVEWRSR